MNPMLWVAKHSAATGTAHHVLLVLAAYADTRGHGARPSERTLADNAGLARSTVQHALRVLEAGGRVTRTGRHESGAVIRRINLPRGWTDSRAETGPTAGHESSSSGDIPF